MSTPDHAPGIPRAPRCEYHVNPLAIHTPAPRFSWEVNDPRRGAVQGAYQVLVASSVDLLNVDAPDLWDSGQVASDTAAHIAYAGPRLKSRARAWWKVRTWDGAGAASPWTEPQTFEMGLLKPRDWTAQWIGRDTGKPESPLFPCPHLRHEWHLKSPVASARLYLSALGLCDVAINGQPVSDAAFLPGWTDYRQRVPYRAFDVTALLRPGPNAIGAILANGWYSSVLAWFKEPTYGHQPRLLAQLEIALTDGSLMRIVSDGTWKTGTGPIVFSDFLKGETHDARLALGAWTEPGFDDANWRPAVTEPLGPQLLDAHAGPPVRSLQELPPKTITARGPGTFIVDFGQNLVGHVRLRLPAGIPPGTTLTLRHAEMLNPDGSLYVANLRTADATDRYVTAGAAATWEPRFTFHGFRYAELSGWPADATPGADTLTGIVRHSDIPFTGTFDCSHPLLNQLQHNIQWGQRGNFLEIPTDCPQRNERLGWMGDAQIFCRTACFNADVAAFFTQWMTTVVEAQRPDGNYTDVAPDVIQKGNSPGWTDAGLIVPWTLYRCYGDTRVLERHYESFKRYIACLDRNSPGHIGPDEGYGDWLQVDTFTPLDLIATAYFAHSTDLMQQIATALGRRADARRYASLLRRIKRAFVRQFVTAEGRVSGETQAAYVLALSFDLVPEKLRPAAVRHLVHQVMEGRSAVWSYPKRNGHLSTGFLAVNKICDALTAGGRLDLAYRLLLNETYPSWLFPVKQGATTIWERWDGWTPEKGFADPGMNSFNHYAYGAIGEWLYGVVAGLDLAPGTAGYTRLALHPHLPPATPDGTRPLTHATATYASIGGPIRCGWHIAQRTVIVEIAIPANAQAQVTLPGARPEDVTESGAPLANAAGVAHPRDTAAGVTFALGAGAYRFTYPLPA